jgi:uncharacterized protein
MKRNIKILAIIPLLAAAILGLSQAAFAQLAKYPSQPQGYVSDYVGILDPQTKQKIISLAAELEKKTTAQLAVVIVPTTQPETIEGYAVNLFERWGIGQRGKDNGLLLLVAYNDKKLRIETGYGLEGAIPDAIAKNIIERIIVPEFKSGNFSKGILNGASALVSLAAKEYNATITGDEDQMYEYVRKEPPLIAKILHFIFTFIIIILFLSLRLGFLPLFFLLGTGRRRGGFWYGSGFGGSSGGFGGGFGGFGGGFSGGGGASGGW